MFVETLAIVAVGGIGFSVLRVLSTRMTAVPVTEIDLKDRTLERSIGVRDGERLDVWIAPGAKLPARAVRILRGQTEAGRGLRLSLYAGRPGVPERAAERLVRTFMGPLPDEQTALVEVTMRVGKDGGIRIKAVDKATGETLTIHKDARQSPAGRTTIRTKTLRHEAIDLDSEPPRPSD